MAYRRYETALPGVWIIEADVFGDPRGYFTELYNQQEFEKIGLGHLRFVQDNLSFSTYGTLRGLHYQRPPFSQGKLISPLRGKVLDVALDLRKDSPAYGQHLAVELTAGEGKMLYVPEGLAHGFQVLSEDCIFFYKCTGYYHKASDAGIAWDDPALAIPWREIPPVLSDKDLHHPLLSDLDSPF
ncbi:MAG: dTDP-4-dehydrorhamnose 3,5-epimerase [Bacteroidetes bacterium]|jgi:dTDP-4-dehydrorhamnose 3,5-epimerase|nr:MAG: dTDP-4-dehydrorhamnose 3,5-epimerase [Bacteroidota bacterium]